MHRIRVVGAAMLTATAMVLAGLTAPAPAVEPPVIVHPARLAVIGGATRATWASSNWSGYAETGHFTTVSGSWTVPSVVAGHQSPSSAWYSATWLGIDGFTNSNLIQTGTEQDYYGGSAHYSAWWEILPTAETRIPDSVAPGDVMDANIVQTPTQVSVGGGRFGRGRGTTEYEWTITLRDVTHPWSFTTTQVYGGAGSSAEWVVEAPGGEQRDRAAR
ncbi:MAG: G1 family glutamic endopeptidase [Acidimicrobiales bacterium]